MSEKLKVPHFVSESEEAQWWFSHRDELASEFERAANEGKVGTGSAAARLPIDISSSHRSAAMIRLDPQDISRARQFAKSQGVHVDVYSEELLHKALVEEEKRSAL